jgi:serine/threonine protein phosphatase PrpC
LALKVESAAASHVGLVRSGNEDSFGVDRELGLFVVCDGMGGARGGEVASELAVATFLSIARQELHACPDAHIILERAVAAANRAVLERAQWDIRYRGMGTTLVGARLCGDDIFLVNVGDSRAYLVRDDQAIQLTEDHSLVAERVRSGMMTPTEAEQSPIQSVITRAIGIESDVRPDLFRHPLEPGDVILLASDGLTRHAGPQEIYSLIAAAHSAEQACQALISHANAQGGKDNITCIILRVDAL